MAIALLAALLPVAAGIGLALTPVFRRGLRGPAAAFAIAVAIAVVFGDLFPHAVEHIGVGALFWLGVGLFAPAVVERIAARIRPGGSAGLHVGFLALCVHQVVDGIQVGAGLTLQTGGWAIAGAVGAHSVPLVGAVTLGFAQRDGAPRALLRGAGLLVCTGIGVAIGDRGLGWFDALGWLPALIGGLLLHVLWHDLWEAPPQGARGRSIELGAFVLGGALPMAFMHFDEGEFSGALAELAVLAAPVLLLGLGASALVRALGTDLPGRPGLLRGAVSAALVPVNECSVLPRTETLDKRGAATGALLAFLLVTPALGLDTLLVSGALLGPELALARLGLAVLLPIGAALVFLGPSATEHAESIPISRGSFQARARTALSEQLLHDGPWLVASLLFAAALQATLPDYSGEAHWFVVAIVVVLIAMPSFVPATASIPVAFVLLHKGVAPWAVLTLLVVGPALNLATMRYIGRRFGTRGTLAVMAFVAAVGGLSYALAPAVVDPLAVDAIGLPALSILGVLLLASAWRVGPRGWLAVLSDLGGPGSGHDHGHDHGHAHEHADTHHGLGPVEAAHAGELAHDHCHDHGEDP